MPEERPAPPGAPRAGSSPAPHESATGAAARTEDPRPLSPAARRALAEAEERRRQSRPLDLPPEIGGRPGPEPVRYGDWERKGIAVDF